jgi:hypothetical protein
MLLLSWLMFTQRKKQPPMDISEIEACLEAVLKEYNTLVEVSGFE